jgi:magnesium-protoporphyrin O-methyltransferase
MPGCCDPDEYAKVFTPRQARRAVRRYLDRGLGGTAGDLARAVAETGIDSATVLEVGGGAGTIQVELLRRGAASAVNIELSPNWEVPAAELADEAGVSHRVTRRVGDFVSLAPTLEAADVVVLHRVVCCYPDWKAMLDAAGRLAYRVVALTFPVDRWWTRWYIRVANLLMAATGSSFRAFVHPAAPMLGVLGDAGFTTTHDRSGAGWRTVVVAKP